MSKGRRFTPEEDALVFSDLPIKEIAERTGRTIESIYNRRWNARHAEDKKQWYENSSEEYKEQRNAYLREYSRNRRKTHRKEVNAYQREYYSRTRTGQKGKPRYTPAEDEMLLSGKYTVNELCKLLGRNRNSIDYRYCVLRRVLKNKSIGAKPARQKTGA